MKMNNKLFFRISTIYWIIQSAILFYTTGFGYFPKIIAILIFLSSLLLWGFSMKDYIQIYSILMVGYSIVYMLSNILLWIFFSSNISTIIIMLSVTILNFIISILMLKRAIKKIL